MSTKNFIYLLFHDNAKQMIFRCSELTDFSLVDEQPKHLLKTLTNWWQWARKTNVLIESKKNEHPKSISNKQIGVCLGVNQNSKWLTHSTKCDRQERQNYDWWLPPFRQKSKCSMREIQTLSSNLFQLKMYKLNSIFFFDLQKTICMSKQLQFTLTQWNC